MTLGDGRLRAILLAILSGFALPGLALTWGLLVSHPSLARDCEMAPVSDADAISLARPVAGSVSREFGQQYNEATQKKDFNDGVDFEVMAGEPVYAAASGVVVEATSAGARGTVVRLDHGRGFATAYAGLSRANVAPGSCIKAGEKLGEARGTEAGATSGLHFQVLRDGKPVNPLDYLD